MHSVLMSIDIHIVKVDYGNMREFIFIKYIKKVQQMDYPDNGLKAQGLQSCEMSRI